MKNIKNIFIAKKTLRSVISRNENSLPLCNFRRLDFSYVEKTGRRIIGILTVLLVLSTSTRAQQQNHLDGYLTIAAENNPGLKAKFDRYMAAMEKLPQAKSLPDPTVMFNIFASPVETRVGAQRLGIGISQAFPWFGQLKSQEEAAALKAKAFFEVFTDEKNRIYYQVKATYYDLYVLEVAIAITQRNLELLDSFRELARVKLESGRGSAVDLLRVEMQIAELDNQMAYLIDTRHPLRAEFRALLNVELDIPVLLPSKLSQVVIANSKSEIMESILAGNPSLKKIDFEIGSLNSQIDVVQSMGKPSFNVGIGYTNISKRSDVSIADNGKDVLIFPQIGVRIPLYRKKYDAMVKEKTYFKTSNVYKKENKENVLNTQLEKVWRNYQDALRRVKLNIKLADLANQSLNILVAEYTSAGKNFEEILRMERKVLTYELELEKGRADQNTSAAFIKYLTGASN